MRLTPCSVRGAFDNRSLPLITSGSRTDGGGCYAVNRKAKTTRRRPPYYDERQPPAKIVELKKRIREADAILIVTPEYNYSIPGVLKNAIDWASRPYGDSAWSGKPAAIMGASIGKLGTARAQYHLRQVFVFLNMHPINQPEVMIGNAAEHFDAEGSLIDEATKGLIRRLLENLVNWTRRIEEIKRDRAA